MASHDVHYDYAGLRCGGIGLPTCTIHMRSFNRLDARSSHAKPDQAKPGQAEHSTK